MIHKSFENWKGSKILADTNDQTGVFDTGDINQEAVETYEALLDKLDDAIQLAIDGYETAQRVGAIWKGTEGNDVAEKLKQIYAAFSCGDPRDTGYSDEIFK